MNPMFRVGYKRPLDRGDIYDLPEDTKADEVDSVIEEEWRRQLKKDTPRLWQALGRGFWGPFIGAFFLKVPHRHMRHAMTRLELLRQILIGLSIVGNIRRTAICWSANSPGDHKVLRR